MSGKKLFQSISICVLLFFLYLSACVGSRLTDCSVPDDSKNVRWQTRQQWVNVDGTDYEVKILIANPVNESSDLVMQGWKVRDFPNVESKNVVLRTLSQAYQEIRAYLNGGVYEGQKISYAYYAEQTVSFIYVREPGAKQMRLSHISSMCTATVGYQYSRLKSVDGTTVPDAVQDTMKFLEIPDGYNSIPLAVKAYKESGTTTAFVANMKLTGVESQTVTMLHLLKPKSPKQIK